MKRTSLRTVKQTFLAVPAAALMLGVSQAGTTVGLNFQAYYYDSGTTPQTVGFGTGYQTTGFPVTARAFGVGPTNWYNTDPLPAQAAISGAATFNGSATFAGSLSANVTAPNSWQSGIGEQNDGFNASPGLAETVPPGNDEVTWGYLDDGNTTGKSPSVQLAGLASLFPHGYVLQSIAANSGQKTYNNVDFTDGSTFTNSAPYTTYTVYSPDSHADVPFGTVGISASSPVLTSDPVYVNGEPKTSGNRSTLAGVIITDQPVVSQDPDSVTNNQGSPLILKATAIGIPPLSYQWRLNGSILPGAIYASYTNSSLTPADAGNYDVVVTNLYGSTTSLPAVVGVNQVPLITSDLSSTTNSTYAGFKETWSVVAAGALPLSYQWFNNGAPIAGATNSSLTVNSLSAGLSAYSVIITNIYGSAYSSTNDVNALAAPDNYTAQVGQDSPDSYWPLSETSGTTAYDYSGHGHNAEQTNNMTIGAAGPQPPTFPGFSSGKTAYQFDGSSAFLVCGTNASIAGTNDFAVEAWINTTAAASQVIVNQRDESGTGYVGEYGCVMNADGSLNFYLYGSGGYQFSFNSSSKVVNDGKWHQVAFVRSGTNGIIYIDGANVGSASGAVQPLGGTIKTFIGADERNNSTFFSGSMADVAIYTHALSQAQVINHYVAASGITMTLGLVPGGVIQDSKPVGAPNDGLNRGTTWLASSTDLNSVTRTGVEQFSEAKGAQIQVPSSANLQPTNGTISFWMQYNFPGYLPGSGNEGAMLMDCRTTSGTVIVLNSSGNIEFQAAGGARFTSTTTTGYVVDGNWHHVAITYGQTTNDAVTLYIDGASDTIATNPGAWSWPAGQEIELGRSHDSYWYVYDGQMDDFRMYNRILTSSEISTIGTEATSDQLVDTNALVLRYDFNADSALYGHSAVWPFGTLITSPVLGPSAVWTPVPNAVSPQPIPINAPSAFYRLEEAP